MKMICSFVILVKRYQKIMLMMATKTVPMVPMNLMIMMEAIRMKNLEAYPLQ